MNEIGKKIVIVMLVMAIFVTVFGVGVGFDFFSTLNHFFDGFSSLAEPALSTLKHLFVGEQFEVDDVLSISRYYFDDGNYVDIAEKVTGNYWYDSFTTVHFVYSSNEKVTKFSRGYLGDILTMRYSFVNSTGDVIYKIGAWDDRYVMVLDYYHYCLDYQKNPSTEGWKYHNGFNVVPN